MVEDIWILYSVAIYINLGVSCTPKLYTMHRVQSSDPRRSVFGSPPTSARHMP